MFEIDKQWIERLYQCLYKAQTLEKNKLVLKLNMLELKFFNLKMEDEDWQELDLIEEELEIKYYDI